MESLHCTITKDEFFNKIFERTKTKYAFDIEYTELRKIVESILSEFIDELY